MISELINKFKKSIKSHFSQKLLFVDSSVHCTGKNYMRFGQNVMISQNTWLNVNERGEDRIILGNNVFIGRNNFFTSGAKIDLGDYTITSVNCSFIGSQHDFQSPLIPYLFSKTECRCVIKIECNCFIGANVTIIGNTHIGFGSIIGANSFLIDADIPPCSVIVGNIQYKILKRYSFCEAKWKI